MHRESRVAEIKLKIYLGEGVGGHAWRRGEMDKEYSRFKETFLMIPRDLDLEYFSSMYHL